MSDRLLKESDVLKLSYSLPIVLNSTFYKMVKSLPSAQPKTGEWIDEGTFEIACSKCLARFNVIDNETERFDYCPHCGADMKGADDDI